LRIHEERRVSNRGDPHWPETTSREEWAHSIMFQEINFPVTPAITREKTSMIKRIAAVTFIFLCTAVAWAILGATIFDRT
jgi:hypothetical protein